MAVGCCVAGNDTGVLAAGALWAGVVVPGAAAVVAREGEVTEEEEGSLGRHVGLARLCARELDGDWNSGCLPEAPVEGCVEEGVADVAAAAALAVGCCVGGAATCCGGGVGLPCTILLYDVAVVVVKAGRFAEAAAAVLAAAPVEGGCDCD